MKTKALCIVLSVIILVLLILMCFWKLWMIVITSSYLFIMPIIILEIVYPTSSIKPIHKSFTKKELYEANIKLYKQLLEVSNTKVIKGSDLPDFGNTSRRIKPKNKPSKK